MAATAAQRAVLTDDACAEAALATAERAWRAAGHDTVDLVIDRTRVRVRLAGARTAAAIVPPLNRIVAPVEGVPDVVLTAFDSAESGERPLLPAGEPGRRNGARCHLTYEPVTPVLSALDSTSRTGVFWTEDASALPIWHSASPLRDLLRWALRPHGLHYVHGAVVGDERGGVLLAGASGSGKSTTALTCAARGARHLTDDYCVVTLDEPPVAHALFATAKLDGPALARLGLPAVAPSGGKAVLAPGDVGPTVDRLALRALVLPRVGERTGRLEPISAAAALAGLAPSTLIQLPGSSAADLAAMRGIVRSLPAYRLEVGPDLDVVEQRVREALAR